MPCLNFLTFALFFPLECFTFPNLNDMFIIYFIQLTSALMLNGLEDFLANNVGQKR